MGQKTQIHAEDGKQELTITREFDLPVDLLFTAHTDPDLFEQWMSYEYATVKVIKMESKRLGSWQFQNIDGQGKVVFQACGVIHEFVPNQKITRTFEMENTGFGVQLEYMDFEKLSEDTSKLTMHIVFRSVAYRDQLLSIPFAPGLNMAHNRLQTIVSKLK